MLQVGKYHILVEDQSIEVVVDNKHHEKPQLAEEWEQLSKEDNQDKNRYDNQYCKGRIEEIGKDLPDNTGVGLGLGNVVEPGMGQINTVVMEQNIGFEEDLGIHKTDLDASIGNVDHDMIAVGNPNNNLYEWSKQSYQLKDLWSIVNSGH